MADFQDLKAVLRRWPEQPPAVDGYVLPIERRVAKALARLREDPDSVGVGDLAGLIRHLLRLESLLRSGEVGLQVPQGPGWPTRKQWEASSVDVRVDLGSSFRIVARPWAPSWLEDDFDEAMAVRGAPCRSTKRRVPADPVVKNELGIESFHSPGQAGAMRAVAFLPHNETLVVGLPTGSGKSLLFQFAAVRAARQGRTTVIVVPTTALAVDQEARMREILARSLPEQAAFPIAYHSGLEPEVKRAFRARLKAGEQCVVIASPEAIVGALRVSLQKVAGDGRLAWLAVDEAHMVSQWGDNFRPEFQLLAALAVNWRTIAPKGTEPRTLLLSATLTNDCVDTLRTLFAPLSQTNPETGGRESHAAFHLLVVPQLRSEPQYWIAAANDAQQRREWVTEAVRHAPRPLIVYTAKRHDAAALAEDLKAHFGYRRIALFRGGDAGTVAGVDNLKGWNDGGIDVVIATSAFGLGMDNSEVRTVIHACVPETVDRFYQEVGRGGRDGGASLSLWLHAPEDRDVAKKLAEKRLIGLERGWNRWSAMEAHAEPVLGLDDAYTVRLDETPPDLHDENDANRAWNVRTLILMARAGLISLGTPTFEWPEQREHETDADYETRCEVALLSAFGRAVIVRKHQLSEDAWCRAVADSREQAKRREEADGRRLEVLLTAARPFSEILAETYTLDLGRQQVVPTPFPGQCPVTRGHRGATLGYEQTDFAYTPGLLSKLSAEVSIPGLPATGVHWISYAPPGPKQQAVRKVTERLSALLRGLVRCGIAEIAVPEGVELDVKRLLNVSPYGYVAFRRLSERDPPQLDGAATELPLPRVSLFPFDLTSGRVVQELLSVDRPLHIVVIPEAVSDPDRPDRSYTATRRCDRMSALLERWKL
ncbi:MAG: protein DpdF [Enhygromyxa sp.]